MTDWISETLYSNGTLKNKLHIHNAQKLSNIEYLRTTIKSIILLDQKPKITSIKDLGKIHK
ncbi:MAG: cell division protein, partial [Candidatus Lactobacillus pullistercoris]|nr:cell division protein [Candidatus Lactobacillus pullistercoris]